MHGRLNARIQQGFSLIELIIVIAVIALLAGAMTPFFSGVSQSGKVASFLQLYSALKTGCEKHKIDTGTFAWEYNGYAAANRLLSATQTYSGWKGPYIEMPFTNGNNPFNKTCGLHLYATANPGNWITAGGWDLDGDGTVDVTTGTACNVLWMPCVTAAEAKEVDDSLDKGIGGTSWASAGRVVYLSASSYLLVLVSR